MKSSAMRSGKYGKKASGDVAADRLRRYGETQRGQFRQSLRRQVQIERKVKSILEASGSMPALNHFYMNFGKRVDRIRATYHGPVAWDEACIEYGRWEMRGLDKDILDKIVCNIMVSPCNPCPPCPPEYGTPWTGQLTVYYAGDDGTYQKGYTTERPIVKGAGCARFIDNGDGTTTDNATGLMWVRCPTGLGVPFNAGMSWTAAIDACEALTYAGHSDWRLPNLKEFYTVLDLGFFFPAVDNAFFALPGTGSFWVSTTYPGDTTSAFRVAIADGNNGYSPKTATSWKAWPVRLGQP